MPDLNGQVAPHTFQEPPDLDRHGHAGHQRGGRTADSWPHPTPKQKAGRAAARSRRRCGSSRDVRRVLGRDRPGGGRGRTPGVRLGRNSLGDWPSGPETVTSPRSPSSVVSVGSQASPLNSRCTAACTPAVAGIWLAWLAGADGASAMTGPATAHLLTTLPRIGAACEGGLGERSGWRRWWWGRLVEPGVERARPSAVSDGQARPRPRVCPRS